jgi:hypothetical protein
MSVRPFREVLGNLRAGQLDEDLTVAMNELVRQVQLTDKGGSLTLTISLKPTKGLALEIEDTITVKAPQLSKPSTLLYPTTEGNLQVNNPMQKSLDLQVVHDAAPGALQKPAGDTPAPLAQVPGAAAG